MPSVTGSEYDVQKRIYDELDGMGLSPEFLEPDESEMRKHKDFFETTSFEKYGYENRPNAVALHGGDGGGRSLCLSGHVDVVSPEPMSKWTLNPWSTEVSESEIHGRGAGDMKAGVAAMIFAVQALQANGVRLKGDVQLETTIEEEGGGVGGVLYLRTVRPRTDTALVPEPSSHAISLASAGVMYFRVTVPGVPAHAATAHFGVNAIGKMVRVIEEIEQLHRDRQSRIKYHLVDANPEMRGRATMIDIGVIRAGDWPSTVPGSCEIECRVGFPPGETREQVMRENESAVDRAADRDEWLSKHRPQVTWFGWKARPHETDESDPFVQQVRSSVEQVVAVTPAFIGGASGLDTRHFVHHGIPTVTCGPQARRIHSYDESVNISSIVQTAQVIALTMMDWCGVS
ncbi:MAG: acetylornithine deacetylase [Candidatus Thorarchaeota archaeon]|nr:MAG: acetylornithine deacetylase [Candidatus Thorarchaeota archaeon]RLI59209.1 MAG: acetylornithine deacetylase [Candidatus Thorarchaeota archaeon]